MASLVALATTVDVDGLKLGLGGNSHGGLDLNAENNVTFVHSLSIDNSEFSARALTVSKQLLVYLLARHDNFGGFDADSWHFSSFLRFDKSWITGEPERTYILVLFVNFRLFLRLASSLVTSLLLSF